MVFLLLPNEKINKNRKHVALGHIGWSFNVPIFGRELYNRLYKST